VGVGSCVIWDLLFETSSNTLVSIDRTLHPSFEFIPAEFKFFKLYHVWQIKNSCVFYPGVNSLCRFHGFSVLCFEQSNNQTLSQNKILLFGLYSEYLSGLSHVLLGALPGRTFLFLPWTCTVQWGPKSLACTSKFRLIRALQFYLIGAGSEMERSFRTAPTEGPYRNHAQRFERGEVFVSSGNPIACAWFQDHKLSTETTIMCIFESLIHDLIT